MFDYQKVLTILVSSFSFFTFTTSERFQLAPQFLLRPGHLWQTSTPRTASLTQLPRAPPAPHAGLRCQGRRRRLQQGHWTFQKVIQNGDLEGILGGSPAQTERYMHNR
jgi:hypothetical protein